MSSRIGVLLSGCGFLDGAEIREAVLTLLALDRLGAEAVCLAPAGPQRHVVDHRTGKEVVGAARDMLAEAARIARGEITDLGGVTAAALDGLILPGGYGAAKNLSDFAFTSARATVHPQVARLLLEMHRAGKPIGAICIAPALLARVLGRRQVRAKLTIGTDAGTAAALEKMGVEHINCACASVVVDEAHRVVSTPAYMSGSGPAEVFEGIRQLVTAVLSLASTR